MDVELFEEFGMIAKHGNLSEAARELHVTQSALSRHLATLEKQLGVELFDRSTSPMRLTPEGEAFLHWSSLISNSYKKMIDHMSTIRGSRPQVLKVSGLLESDAAAPFKAACRSLKEEDDRFSVSFASDVGQTPFDLVRAGELDAAVEPFSGMIDVHDVESVRLAEETSHVVMERTHPWSQRSALGIDDVRSGSFVSLRTNKDHANRKHLQDICRRNGFPGDVPGNLETRNSETFSEVLLAGLGDSLLMLPESMAKRLCANEGDQYVSVPLTAPNCDYDIRAFYSKTPSLPASRLVERLTSLLA